MNVRLCKWKCVSVESTVASSHEGFFEETAVRSTPLQTYSPNSQLQFVPDLSPSSDDLPSLEHKQRDHNPCYKEQQTQPKHPTDPRSLSLLALLALQPRVTIRRVSRDGRPERVVAARAA